ncbi:molybdate ABC transporter substrate-binding protein [Enterovibrio makurazakiensis]|uniref:Molybdate ABC transporter substrate-binding protein n=1 Tax=Enterovibrio gelatinilyticus TaxID=2899819 RepID=A0ABT5QVU7_9GAMM|nr:molybdate ABC transporter substrate-binding protein [Enterovibrio sp. ZSDZ42]MDD1792136.1 molybdate ABC transporter substrate-binding protein [Enterovibrio sp. ZSDZ42]
MQRIFLFLFITASFLPRVVSAEERVLVFAASSMTTALNEIAQTYEQETEQAITISYASSSALARQLAYGAPADIYISANEKWMEYAVSELAIEPETVSPWVENELVLVADRNLIGEVTLTVEAINKAIGNSRIAISDPNHVPAGIYAKQALVSIDLWRVVEDKLALSNSVRATLALVERGEAPLGVVYLSDALASSSVKVVADIPSNTHTPIVFPKAMTPNASDEAKRFFSYLDSPKAKSILQGNGFVVIHSSQEQL